MKVKYIIILIVIFFCSCNDSKETQFLNNFKDIKKIDNNSFVKVKKEINNEDLYVLTKTDAKNEFVFNVDKKYYYGHKIKISEDCYLLSYTLEYRPLYKPTIQLINWEDKYLCIYQINIGIVSKVKIESSDPISSGFSEKEGIYTIKSFFNNFNYTEEDKPYFHFDSIISKYKIENNRFVEIK